MIAAKGHFESKAVDVRNAVKKAAFTNIGHAAASVRKAMVKGIRQRKNKDLASPPGTPVFTHGGLAKHAIRFHVDRQREEAVIGPRFSVIGTIMRTHEFGEVEDGRDYPERPTAAPALEASLGRIAGQWQGSIGT